MPWKVPARLTPTIFAHARSEYSCSGRAAPMPALLNSTVIPPSASAAAVIAAVQASGSATSAVNATPSTSAATRGGTVGVDVDDRDRGALLVHPAGGGGADPRRAPGDDGALTVEQTHGGGSYGAARVPRRSDREAAPLRPTPSSASASERGPDAEREGAEAPSRSEIVLVGATATCRRAPRP